MSRVHIFVTQFSLVLSRYNVECIVFLSMYDIQYTGEQNCVLHKTRTETGKCKFSHPGLLLVMSEVRKVTKLENLFSRE